MPPAVAVAVIYFLQAPRCLWAELAVVAQVVGRRLVMVSYKTQKPVLPTLVAVVAAESDTPLVVGGRYMARLAVPVSCA